MKFTNNIHKKILFIMYYKLGYGNTTRVMYSYGYWNSIVFMVF